FKLVGVLSNPAAPDILQIHDKGEFFRSDPSLVIDKAIGVRERDGFAAHSNKLFDRVLRHVAAAGNQACLTLQFFLASLEHSGREVNCSVSGRFRADNGAAPGGTLPSKDPGELVFELLVHPE